MYNLSEYDSAEETGRVLEYLKHEIRKGNQVVTKEGKNLLLESIESCLRETFKCDILKRGCTVVLKGLDWKGFEIDLVGYSVASKSIYIVEAGDTTLFDSGGIASVVGRIVVDMAGMPEREVLESIQQYAELGNREIAGAHFYIALPNFLGAIAEKTLHPPALSLLKRIHKMLSGWVGLLEVYDLNMPARVVEGLESEFIK